MCLLVEFIVKYSIVQNKQYETVIFKILYLLIDEFHQLQYRDTDDAGMRPRLAHELMTTQVGGEEHLRFTHTDYKNYIQCRKIEFFGINALEAILNYFGGKDNDSKQFYKMQLDESRMIENIFWLDHVMQNCCLLFGDFASFDTTYRTVSFGALVQSYMYIIIRFIN